MKRFYSDVAIDQDGEGWFVTLDARALPTPAKAPMRLPTEALTLALADEWRAQGEKIDPATMPVMTLAATAIDRVAANRDLVVRETAAYAGDDLVCYWAERPDALVRRQAQLWQPVLDWADGRFLPGFTKTAGIVHVAQSDAALAAVAKVLDGLDNFALNAVVQLTQNYGSTLLAIGVVEGAWDITAASNAAFVDDDYQAETWGYDKEAHERIEAKRQDALAVARFLDLLKDKA